MKHGLIRIGACTPKLLLGNPLRNAEIIADEVTKASSAGISVLCFPELSLTGYTCSDLFLQKVLRAQAVAALIKIVEDTKDAPIVFTVGLPIAYHSKLYNCAAVICHGKILGFVPKRNIPNFGEFYERRHFSAGPASGTILFNGQSYPFGSNQIFVCHDLPELRISVEICEDLFVPTPPSATHAAFGATVILNLSASDELVTKADFRRDLIRMHSARLICAYAYADAGNGESTTDMVFAGHNIISENGRILCESQLFSDGLVYQDVDIELLTQDRLRQSTFPDYSAQQVDADYRRTDFSLPNIKASRDTVRLFNKHPFVPTDHADRDKRCNDILNIQAHGLARRLSHIHSESAIIGVSGGLDSTLALLVTIRAFDILGLSHAGIYAVSMPGVGSTSRTRDNSEELSIKTNTTFMTIPIQDAVSLHFRDIGHDANLHDVTFENSQARERTQILMDLANRFNGLVVGTGDLSELALGWATYNGDHMSMYAVNASVPKTLVKDLVLFSATQSEPGIAEVLRDIANTPPSPELLPHDNNTMTQITEDLVGPYELHDFFLYYFVRYGFSPSKIAYMATLAFIDSYDFSTIKKWLKVFIRRFFSQQFKRSCMPDGPKVGSVSLSPRGDWRMPSDALVDAWMNSMDSL
ncbi:MAG TPA: NAD(+) synthase [Clostridiaceae bacterium]|jgi:NAD+ synthase (glutamine-hydrolysing)|nr:NAD(+) synthase [Clostridiaceae bacterium]